MLETAEMLKADAGGAGTGAGVAVAEANHGRWIVKCPWCPSAQVASESKAFFCYACNNGGLGKVVPVTWPDATLRGQVETLLAVRLMANQNWLPGETAADLTAENIANKIGGP